MKKVVNLPAPVRDKTRKVMNLPAPIDRNKITPSKPPTKTVSKKGRVTAIKKAQSSAQAKRTVAKKIVSKFNAPGGTYNVRNPFKF
jgi:hypothetical protein